MCLISKTNIPSIAKEDIPIYKIVAIVDNSIVTPIIGLSITELPGTLEDDDKPRINQNKDGEYEISRGFIHAYTKEIIAEDNIASHCVLKGYIPVGTEYFEGNRNDICATKMVFQEIFLTEQALEDFDKSLFPNLPVNSITELHSYYECENT